MKNIPCTVSIFIVLFLSLFTNELQAQITQACLAIGGIGEERAHSIQQTSDGGYIVAGATHTYGDGSNDGYIVKLDAEMNMEWNKTYGGAGDDQFYSIIQTTDGGYMACGFAFSFGAGGYDVYIVKLDADGNLMWSGTFGGPEDDFGWSIQQTSDGGYLVAGYTESFGAGDNDFYILKLDGNGDLLSSKTIGDTGSEVGDCIQLTWNSGYFISGYTTSSFGLGQSDFYVAKVDANNNLIWEKAIGGSHDDQSYSAIQTSDGGYLMTGFTTSFGSGGKDVYVVKLDFNGDLEWTKTIGGAGDDCGYSVKSTPDGGYIIAGSTSSYGTGGNDIYIIKLDVHGNVQWTKTADVGGDESANSIQLTSDQGYILAGFTNSIGSGDYDYYIMKTDPVDNSCCTESHINSIGTGGAITVGGRIEDAQTTSGKALGTVIGSGGILTENCKIAGIVPINDIDILVSPNPSHGVFTVSLPKNIKFNSLTILDIFGRTIYQNNIEQNLIRISLPEDALGGVYFIKLEGKNVPGTYEKIILN